MRALSWSLVLSLWVVGCGGRAEELGGANSDSGPEESTGTTTESSGDSSSNDTESGGSTTSAGTTSAGATTGVTSSGDSSSAGDSNSADDSGDSDAPVSLDQEVGGLPEGSGAVIWDYAIGNWFREANSISDAPLATFEPARDGSSEGRTVSGSGLVDGGWLWLELSHPLQVPVDLSEFSGISFWVRLVSGNQKLRVILNIDGSPRDGEGSIEQVPVVELEVGEAWERFELPFSEFGVDAPQVVHIEFNAGYDDQPFELWIDDLGLTKN